MVWSSIVTTLVRLDVQSTNGPLSVRDGARVPGIVLDVTAAGSTCEGDRV